MRTTSASGPQIRSPQRLYLLAAYAVCVCAHVRVYIVFLCCVCSFARIVLVSGVRNGCVRGVGGKRKRKKRKKKKVFVHGLWSSPRQRWRALDGIMIGSNILVESRHSATSLPQPEWCKASPWTVEEVKRNLYQLVLLHRIPNCGSSSELRFVSIQETDQLQNGRTS